MQLLPPNPNSVEWPEVNLFIPYVEFYPATLISLIGFNYQPVKTEGDYGYSEYFKKRWEEGKDFITVEQDTVVWPGAIKSIWECPENICLYNAHLPNQQTRNLENETKEYPLACIKISKEVIRWFPNFWDNPVEWSYCGQHLATTGVKVHEHHPGIVNANNEFLKFLKGIEY